MKEEVANIKKEFLKEIKEVKTEQQLADIKVKYVGKKGKLTLVLRSMGKLSPEERPVIGSLVNEVRDEIENLVEEKKQELKREELQKRLQTEDIDVTEPSKKIKRGSLHPIKQVIKEVEEVFLGMGYEIADGPEIEKTYYVFDQLNTPIDHPARDLQDTFYITDDVILRTQTSSVQIRTMENKKPPIKISC